MPFEDKEKIDILYKKNLYVSSTNPNIEWYLETNVNFNEYFFSSDIFTQQIPDTFVSYRNIDKNGLHVENISENNEGTVRYYDKLILQEVNGTNKRSYYYLDQNGNNILKNAIPFNYKKKSSSQPYLYNLYFNKENITGYDSNYPDNTEYKQITPGNSGGDWIFDIKTGVVTFYSYGDFIRYCTTGYLKNAGVNVSGTIEDNTLKPPVLSFYKYIGNKGLNNLIQQKNYEPMGNNKELLIDISENIFKRYDGGENKWKPIGLGIFKQHALNFTNADGNLINSNQIQTNDISVNNVLEFKEASGVTLKIDNIDGSLTSKITSYELSSNIITVDNLTSNDSITFQTASGLTLNVDTINITDLSSTNTISFKDASGIKLDISESITNDITVTNTATIENAVIKDISSTNEILFKNAIGRTISVDTIHIEDLSSTNTISFKDASGIKLDISESITNDITVTNTATIENAVIKDISSTNEILFKDAIGTTINIDNILVNDISSTNTILFKDASGDNFEVNNITVNNLTVNGEFIVDGNNSGGGGGGGGGGGVTKALIEPNEDISGSIYYNTSTFEKTSDYYIDISKTSIKGNLFYSGFKDLPDVSGGGKNLGFLFFIKIYKDNHHH